MVSKASDDLPEPDSPVITTRLSRGMSTSMFLRLCSRAPRTRICCMERVIAERDDGKRLRRSDSSRRLHLARHDGEVALLHAAQQCDRYGNADALLGHQPVHVVDIADRLAVDGDDDVAAADAGLARGAVGRGGLDTHAALAGELVEAHDAARQRDVLPGVAGLAASHPALP